MKFNAGYVHRNLFCNLEFPELSRSMTHRGLNFRPYFPHLLSDLGEIQYERGAFDIAEHCDYCGNRRRVSHAFLSRRTSC